jgi:hypothetical protein
MTAHESVARKADRYLLEGRISVVSAEVDNLEFTCMGDSRATYRVHLRARPWLHSIHCVPKRAVRPGP